MAGAIFDRLSGEVYLLRITPGDGHIGTVYFVLPDDPGLASLDLADTWNLTGSYVFTSAPFDAALTTIVLLVNQQLADSSLTTVDSHPPHAFVWIPQLPVFGSPIVWPQTWKWLGISWVNYIFFARYETQAPIGFSWGQLDLNLAQGFVVTLNGIDGFNITFPSPIGASMDLAGQPMTIFYLKPDSWIFNIALAGSTTGSLNFVIGIDYKSFVSGLGLGFIYAYGSNQGLYYPAFPIPTEDMTEGNYWTFAVTLEIYLNPALPLEGAATRFIQRPPVDAGGPDIDYPSNLGVHYKALPVLPTLYYFTTDGYPLALDPVDQDGLDPGFAFSMAPSGILEPSEPDGPAYYLSPVGLYQILAASPPSNVDVMPGLSGLEYFRLQADDLIEFINNQPAYAPGFGGNGSPVAESPPATQPLTDAYTTSWARIAPPTSGAVRAYFGQPVTSTYFGAGEIGSPASYPEAVQSQLWDFGGASPEPTPVAFPFVPYGAVYRLANEVSPNTPLPAGDAVGADGVMAFESAVLTNQRHALLAKSDKGPIFMPAGAVTPSPTLAAALTPQGLVVDLNADGTWKVLTLARTPDVSNGDKWLQITDPSVELTNVLTRDQLFLVISNPVILGAFQNQINIAGFGFLLDVIPQLGHISPLSVDSILVFKFNDRMSFSDLVGQPSLWADADTFASDPIAVSAKLVSLVDQAANAEGSPRTADLFSDFNRLATDKTWTGILAFNVQVDGNQMASDLQMLLGGIPIDLRAHHIGIETNLIAQGSSSLEIESSSMFGVIYYEPDASSIEPDFASAQRFATMAALADVDDDLDYKVEKLVVEFKNSAVSVFEATVALTIDAIFGRKVMLTDGPQFAGSPSNNSIVIQGQYQVHDGVGTVSFDTTVAFEFAFPEPAAGYPRVLQQLLITRARLVPLSADEASGLSRASTSPLQPVECAFCLEGEVSFAENPFPGDDPVDLFSYGCGAANGLSFSELNVIISFTLDAITGSASPPSLRVDYSRFQPAPADNAIRPNSLLGSLPAKFSRFVALQDLQLAAAASLPIHCTQLAGTSGVSQSSPEKSQVPLVTLNPKFALEYDVSLGSLGTLSDGQAINAKLLVGWGPSAFHPQKDAAVLLVQLPQLSAGVTGIDIEGVLSVQLGVGNLVKVSLDDGQVAYAILFNNAQLSVLGLTFPPGVLADFMVFTEPNNRQGNIAWFLAAEAL